MAYASISGHARTSLRNPRAFGVCFRCSRWFNRDRLRFQHDYRGTSIVNLWILVCEYCYDTPNAQLRAIQLPADPTPVYFPSVEQFAAAETDYRSTLPIPIDPITGLPVPAQTALRVTQDGQNRIPQPIGCPEGLVQNAVMPYNGGTQQAFAVPLSILSVTANGTATVSVTCSRPHGLTTNGQISAEGLTAANGFHSVTVVSATAFTFLTAYNIPAGSLLAPSTVIGGLFNQAGQPIYNQEGIQMNLEPGPSPGSPRIITADAGLPYASQTIPPLGCRPVRPGAAQGLENQAGQQIYNQAGQPIFPG
jgi:hypothetical protein